MRWIALAGMAFLVCGCAPMQQKLQKVEVDQEKFDAASRERSATDHCDQVALPGTTQHMACMLGAVKSSGENPAAK